MAARRQIVLDTETTGLDPAKGDRIIEVACIELSGRMISASQFHAYYNPERIVGEESYAIHGLSDEFLADKPLFAELAPKLAQFLEGADLIFHNAKFDMGFLEAEFARTAHSFAPGEIIDTLHMARRKYPNSRNDLNTLCKRLKIDLSSRADYHGALIDARLLCEAYLEMTGGKQASLILPRAQEKSPQRPKKDFLPQKQADGAAKNLCAVEVPPEAAKRHEALIAKLAAKSKPLWRA